MTGQDGSHLADFLLKKNYQVIGVKEDRQVSTLRELIICYSLTMSSTQKIILN